ncbi:hypothetical protein H310_12317 [Aphanomyces invadans]|uniref:Uncharacterized protein n=1 Tax=Aphanomyces invadans TaxID=157072 RepID=A0A024TJF1_9STRA|nr:hypothetical protein H310_12317 [Aphanomyces invadans]ETV93741.1 hypothetical protein H310_12317 [Aphanomyces invadans]|eukprot:XP_008877550.1 hypothetical protein H310_12317 [Aphanomyces invadans]
MKLQALGLFETMSCRKRYVPLDFEGDKKRIKVSLTS